MNVGETVREGTSELRVGIDGSEGSADHEFDGRPACR